MDKIINTNKLFPSLKPEVLDSCIHCGLCLPACPTYLSDLNENHSPRGRIHLIKAWFENRLEYSDKLADSLDTCLMCLGCETACPSGVHYEEIINNGKIALANYKSPSVRIFSRLVFKNILPNYFILKLNYYFLWIWQFIKGKEFIYWLLKFFQPINKYLPGVLDPIAKLSQLQMFLPPIANNLVFKFKPGLVKGKKTLNFFHGCVMELFYHEINQSTLNILTNNDLDYLIPHQTCCGALALHAGEIDIAKGLARRNIAYFGLNVNPIVVSGSGCAAMLKHYDQLFDASDGEIFNQAKDFSNRVVDITQIITQIEHCKFQFKRKTRIGYHAACHLAHAQKIHQEPIEFFEKLQAQNPDFIEFVAIQDAEFCCGSAGIYNLLHTDSSLAILERKMQFIREANLDLVVTSNPGCLLQLQAGLTLFKVDVKVVHICELLDTLINQSNN